MNIKSLILGSAAALVAAPAMAADLPVAEPVDYVKVCDAYGAGYHFIPGTDTCLKIGGYVRAEAQFTERFARADNKFEIWSRGLVTVTAKEETELGTLVSFIEIQGDTDASGIEMTKAWLSLGGMYAGYITSASVVDHVGGMYLGDFDLGDQTVGAIGYNADLGNGVSAHIAIENEIVEGASAVVGGIEAGQSMPAVAARIKVDQAWGSASLGAVVRQVNYNNAATDSDLGFAVAAGITGKFDALTAALNAVYSEGALGYTAWVGGEDALAGSLSDVWSISGMLKYAFADNAYGLVAAGYGEYDGVGATPDYDEWQITAEVGYTPVKNFTVKAAVLYKDRDSVVAANDLESWEGKIRLQRDF
ncbi:porin [Cohaesibacter sp. CAU 1516]|uniref:porin n=1 Tax=Cohaesibacter sp. CAU 1516 TaxID=2576038 RepID=UPI0014858356|nr:porin [Cohaesibacter sp. CAU 1516]